MHRCPEDPAQIIRRCNAVAPCVLLIHLRFLEAMEGYNIPTLAGDSGRVHILVMAEREELAACRNLLRIGCKGLLVPNLTTEMTVRAISKVIEGEIWMSRTKLSSLLQEQVRVSDEVKLTSREKEILYLVGRGMNNQQIADSLYITRETVRWHIRGLYTKIGMHDRQSVVSYAAEFCAAAESGEDQIPSLSRTAVSA